MSKGEEKENQHQQQQHHQQKNLVLKRTICNISTFQKVSTTNKQNINDKELYNLTYNKNKHKHNPRQLTWTVENP